MIAGINAGALIGLSLDAVVPQTLISGIPAQPFFSPDSRSIAYFDSADSGKLKRIDIGGGPPQMFATRRRSRRPAPGTGTA